MDLMRVPALEIRQGPRRVIYSFAIDGKKVPLIASISRIRRRDGTSLQGYQRPEVLSHIAEIRRYLESPDPMIPNAVVISFDDRVRFVPAAEGPSGSDVRSGFLEIPVDPEASDEDKPGWIVDGQQRLAAVREAAVDRFVLCAVGFIAPDEREQREQFILVNSTKPLPKGLLYELLPTTEGRLASALERRRFPAELLARLNFDEDSPLRGMIRTPTNPEGVVQDNSVLKMLENSLSDGALYRFRDPDDGRGDVDAMLGVLKSFWAAVRQVFPDAWGLPPRKSRLMHGAGVVSLGFLMDAIADRHPAGKPTAEEFATELGRIKDVCRWTHGYWDFGRGSRRKWNELQNTSKDIHLLANFLLHEYMTRSWSVVTGGQT